MTEEQARESMAVSRIDNIAPLQVRQLASEGVVEVATTADTHLVRILAAHMVSQTSAVRPAPEPAAPKTSPPHSGPPALPLALSPLPSRGAGLSLPTSLFVQVRRAAADAMSRLAVKFGEVDDPSRRAAGEGESPLAEIKQLILHDDPAVSRVAMTAMERVSAPHVALYSASNKACAPPVRPTRTPRPL
jgi:hypothetical protein